ncbi:PCYCGC motif-containing (lipo)protein [Polycladomyces abyssicola]|uniref:PCYCGC motif-containing (lipo)protein n=1 Tax=Polycladomyces abyssicola TaxID=1125966 RepID=UPI001BB2DE70|nr:PCYCGC motif-containing (lipo)protein [Polycladomyces abyssicola]
MGDVTEMTSSPNQLPRFLNGKDANVLKIYRSAAKNGDLLQYIPCYCGCGESVGHKNNLNCFVKETKSDGSIVLDSHGMNCGTCLNIASEAIALKKTSENVPSPLY